jgi:imidazolonepropionase-like amidohydrolase
VPISQWARGFVHGRTWLEAIVDAAHAMGRRVTAHAHGANGARRASCGAGGDSIEHGTPLDDEAIQLLRERGAARHLSHPESGGKGAGSRVQHLDVVRRPMRRG